MARMMCVRIGWVAACDPSQARDDETDQSRNTLGPNPFGGNEGRRCRGGRLR